MTPPIPPLNPATLPDNDNIPGNHYAYCVRLNGPLFMQTGRMIAYYPAPNGPGIRFEPLDGGERRRVRRFQVLRPAVLA